MTSIVTKAQNNVAFIVDQDGFPNVRESKSANATIVGEINKGEFFTFKKTTEDWWEINKTFDKDAGWVNLTGFVHKSRIQPIHTLPDAERKKLLKEVFERELELVKAKNWGEREKHHEPKFNMVLNCAVDYITRIKDRELLRVFIETVKLDTGSADEAPTWALGAIFIKQPDWTIEEMKHVGLTTDLIERLEFGFENNVNESVNYAELKKKIEALK